MYTLEWVIKNAVVSYWMYGFFLTLSFGSSVNLSKCPFSLPKDAVEWCHGVQQFYVDYMYVICYKLTNIGQQYHPQCDGEVERCNRTLATMLSMYVEENRLKLLAPTSVNRLQVQYSWINRGYTILLTLWAWSSLTYWSLLPLSYNSPNNLLGVYIEPSTKVEWLIHSSKGDSLIFDLRGDRQTSIIVKPGESHWIMVKRVKGFGYLTLARTPRGLSPNWQSIGQDRLLLRDMQTSEVDYLIKEELSSTP